MTNNYSAQSGTQLGYAGPAGRGGFNRAYMGQPGQTSGIGAQRAATGPEAQNWQPHSDPQPREQSQGKRSQPCGFTGVLFGFGKSALNGNLLKDTFEFAQHGREIALSIMPMEMWELGFQLAVGFSPFDLLYDLGSLVMGKDIISGEALTDVDKAAIFAGFLTLGIGDDLIKAGKKLSALKQVDDLAAGAKSGKKLFGGVVDLFQSKGLRGGLKHLAANIGQKVTNLFEGAKRQAGNLREWVGNFFRKTGDDLPGGSRPVQKIIDRSAELAKLDAEALAQMKRALSYLEDDMEAAAQVERALDKYVIGQFISDAEDINRVTRIGEQAMDAYEAGKKPLQTVTSHFGDKLTGRGMIHNARAGMKLGATEAARVANALRAQQIRKFVSTPIILGGAMGAIEYGRQVAQNMDQGMSFWDAASYENINLRDLGLATATGVGLGLAVGARKVMTGKSYGTAFTQVGVGAVSNIGTTWLGANEDLPASDYYFAALFGGLASPLTGAFENTLRWRTVANATVAASLNSTQYAFSAAYKGQNLSFRDYAVNATGGAFAGAGTAFGWCTQFD